MAKIECKRGHSLTGANLYVHNGKGQCRACRAYRAALTPSERQRERAERQAARAQRDLDTAAERQATAEKRRIQSQKRVLAQIAALEAKARRLIEQKVPICKKGHQAPRAFWTASTTPTKSNQTRPHAWGPPIL